MLFALALAPAGMAASGPFSWDVRFSPTDPTLYSLYTAVDLGAYENNPPNVPSNPYPSDGATGIAVPVTLTWVGGDPDPGDMVTYDVFMGLDAGSMTQVADNLTTESWEATALTPATPYYWQVVATDTLGASTNGPIWSFTTRWQATATATPTTITIALKMNDDHFSTGEACYLTLDIQNPGTTKAVDLYILLAVYDNYWAYPSWNPVEMGLDFQPMTVLAGQNTTTYIIPQFTMPAVSPAGPFYFYAAMFDSGYLDLDHLASNASLWEFYFE